MQHDITNRNVTLAETLGERKMSAKKISNIQCMHVAIFIATASENTRYIKKYAMHQLAIKL